MKRTNTIINNKKSETKMEKIERTYGKDFAVGSNENLGESLAKAGFPSLAKLLNL